VTVQQRRDGSRPYATLSWCQSNTAIDYCTECHSRHARAAVLIVERRPHPNRSHVGIDNYQDEIVAVVCGECGAESRVFAFETLFGDTHCPRCASGPGDYAKHKVYTRRPYRRESCERCGGAIKGKQTDDDGGGLDQIIDRWAEV
jgi:hypothetical protein